MFDIVQGGFPVAHLDIDRVEGLQTRPDAGSSFANPSRHRADQAVVAGQQGDDAVGFTQVTGAQDQSLITKSIHLSYYGTPSPDRPEAEPHRGKLPPNLAAESYHRTSPQKAAAATQSCR